MIEVSMQGAIQGRDALGAQEVMLARVLLFTFPPWRNDSRSRMAGGEERLGTRAKYMRS